MDITIDGKGEDRGRTSSLSESSSTKGGSKCLTVGDVGARKLCSPIIQDQRKEALNRSMTTSLGLGSNPTSERCHTLNPYRVEPSVRIIEPLVSVS